MARVLIVDDSPIQLRVVERLLHTHLPETEVLLAAGGNDALEMLKTEFVDLVLTDMQMTDGDGLQLVKEVKSNYPLIPVILMTGFGNEDTATAALLTGAASYIPKRELDNNLISTVENVLELSQSSRQQLRVLSSLKECNFTFVIENDVTLITPLISCLQNHIGHTEQFGVSEMTRVGVALHECLTNSIYHGNLELNSDLRQEDESIFHLLAAERRDEAPYCNRRVFVTAGISQTGLEFVIRDQGLGFDAKKMLDPERPVDLERIGGRGLTLIQSFMDVVYHNSCGNEIHMIKYPTACRMSDVPTPAQPENAALLAPA
jgi:CheY-like chemotaxis protein/anti-sigma regulatory factor (Ser/Thr protein kinase)